jgi:hypothetical protein
MISTCAGTRVSLGMATLWPGGRVVMQRTANPCTSVRFRPGPPKRHGDQRCLAPPRWPALVRWRKITVEIRRRRGPSGGLPWPNDRLSDTENRCCKSQRLAIMAKNLKLRRSNALSSAVCLSIIRCPLYVGGPAGNWGQQSGPAIGNGG